MIMIAFVALDFFATKTITDGKKISLWAAHACNRCRAYRCTGVIFAPAVHAVCTKSRALRVLTPAVRLSAHPEPNIHAHHGHYLNWNVDTPAVRFAAFDSFRAPRVSRSRLGVPVLLETNVSLSLPKRIDFFRRHLLLLPRRCFLTPLFARHTYRIVTVSAKHMAFSITAARTHRVPSYA